MKYAIFVRGAAALALAIAFGAPALGAVVEISPGADVRAAITALRPGDELVLRGGTYSFNSRFLVTAVGTATQPIVIRGKAGESAVISMETGSQNVIDVEGSRYLVLRNLKITRGSQGIRLLSSSFVTIEDCELYETGDVAIAVNAGGTYEGLLIRRNHIHHTNGTGEGMYLGCNSNGCRVMNSIVEWNYIHHTNRASVEQGDGIELKEGSAGNIIRHNVIHDTNYPGIITYSTVGNGPQNIIEANLIWNTNDNGIQSAADSIIRNNIVLGSPISLQPHQAGSPSNQIVAHNTVITDGNAIEVRSASGSVVVANNAAYSRTGSAIFVTGGNTSLVTVTGNVGVGGVSGVGGGGFTTGNIGADFVNGHYNGAPPINLFPKSGSALVGAGNAARAVDADFNGTPRGGTADVGAYKFAVGGNPGWTLAAGFKGNATGPVPNPPTNVSAN